MKNLKNLFIPSFLFCLAALLTSCSENNLTGPDQKLPEYGLSNNRIQVETYWEGNVLCFKLTNNTRDTIVNDFHVQFDTSVKIIGWITRPGWIIDQATTDTAKGKFGVKAGPQGQPIMPNGGAGIPVGV